MSDAGETFDRSGLRRLTLIVSVIVFVDTTFYAVLAPILPSLVRELHLSKLSAGVLTASFPAGTLIGSLPGGLLASRFGSATAVYVGLGMMGASSLLFGLSHTAFLADLARLTQGIGGACSWAGGLAWLVSAAPPDQRGTVLGRATGAAIAGSLLGPVVGILAGVLGRAVVFGSSVGVALVVGLWASTVQSQPVVTGGGLRHLGGVLAGFPMLFAMWLVALPAVASGGIGVLGPLRMHQFGASTAVIGATFLVAAALESAVSPAVGRLSDRTGRLMPLRAGLAITAVPLVVFALPNEAVAVGAIIVVTTGALGLFWAPVMAMLSDLGESVGLDPGLAFALINLAWAAGQLIGAGGGGAIAKQAGDAVPTVAIAGVFIATLAFVVIRRRAPYLAAHRSVRAAGGVVAGAAGPKLRDGRTG
jgi:MFS family permease